MAIRVGDVGRALSPLGPSGAVELAGVRHDARSDGRFVPAGAEVEVVRADPTGFVVRPVEAGAAPLPDHGRELFRAEFQRNSADVAEAEARELAELWRRHVKRVFVTAILAEPIGMAVGFVAFVSVVVMKNPADPVQDFVAALLIGTAVGGGAWAVVIALLSGVLSWRLDRGAWYAPAFAVVAGLLPPAVAFVHLYPWHEAVPLAGRVAAAAWAGAVAGWLLDRLIVFLCTVLVNAD